MSESILDYWRNFAPVVEDIVVDVPSGIDTYIDLKYLLLQGARDFYTGESPTEGVLDKIPVQRGWLLTPVYTTEPKFGRIENGWMPHGFYYKSFYRFAGTDCFNYILTNGTQESKTGKITVNVVETYSVYVKITKTGNDKYSITAETTDGPGLPATIAKTYSWIIQTYEHRWNETLQRQEVWPITKTIHGTLHGFFADAWWYRVVGNYLPATTFSRDTAFNGYWKDTKEVFEPRDRLPGLELQVKFHTTWRKTYRGSLVPNTAVYNLVTYEFKEFGEKWWTSGNIQGV